MKEIECGNSTIVRICKNMTYKSVIFLFLKKIAHFKNIAIGEHSLKMELKFCTSNSHNLSHTRNLQLKLQ